MFILSETELTHLDLIGSTAEAAGMISWWTLNLICNTGHSSFLMIVTNPSLHCSALTFPVLRDQLLVGAMLLWKPSLHIS